MGLLLALGLACGKQRGFDSIREEAAELGNRHYQNQMGVIYQTGEEGEIVLSLQCFADGKPHSL